jgi:hypothetical protein
MFTWLKGKLGEFHSVLNLPGLREGRPGLLASRSITYFFLRHNSLYSSSRLVTLCLSPMEFPTGDEFQWGEVGEGLVRAHTVVGMFPAA